MKAPIKQPKRLSIALALVLFVLVTTAVAAPFFPSWGVVWTGIYPSSMSLANVEGGTGTSCQLCHQDVSGGNNFNGYGWDMFLLTNSGMSPSAAMVALESMDSDGDPGGSSNIDEINADAQPGWTDGPNNTIYVKPTGASMMNQMPPAGILGSMDPAGCSGSAATFCTAKTAVLCGAAAITSSGLPSATATSGFVVSASPARSCRSGFLVYNTTQVAGMPFSGGTLCIEAVGLQKAGSTNSGGTPGPASCDGTFAIDMNAFAQAAWVVPDCSGSPSGIPPNTPASFLQTPGTDVYTTFWGRDTPSGSFLSGGLQYTVCP